MLHKAKMQLPRPALLDLIPMLYHPGNWHPRKKKGWLNWRTFTHRP